MYSRNGEYGAIRQEQHYAFPHFCEKIEDCRLGFSKG